MDAILAAIVALLVGVVAVTATGVRRYIDAWFRKRELELFRSRHVTGLRNLAEFSFIIDRITKVAQVDRVLVFTGQNGGGLPEAGRPYTVRATFCWASKDGRSDLRGYEYDVLTDGHYTAMLSDMVQHGSVVVTTKDLPDGAILKAFYRDEGVVQSLVYFLSCDGSQMTYLSVASYAGEFTPDQRVLIELQVHRLRAIMARV